MPNTNGGTRLFGLIAIVAALFAVGACSGGGDGGDDVERADGTTRVARGERAYPEFKIAFHNGVDYLDPGLSYTPQGWSIMVHTYLGLLTYRLENGAEGATLIPALAEELPEISGDGLTYRFRLREGLTYSDGKAVRASDFEWTIKRVFLLDSLGAGLFSGIVGADRFRRAKEGDIEGIVTDDDERTIEITLSQPQGDFLNVLATIFASIVPRGTPDTDRSTKPIPATGPYKIESYEPNRTATLVRNPRWRGIEGIHNGNPDRLTFEIIAGDSAALNSVIEGRNDYSFHQIPVDRLQEVQDKYGDRLRLYTPANTYYYFMNTRVRPFDSLEVRQAVNYAVNREEVVRLFRGLATPTENVLPPVYPQYEEISMYPHDVVKARQLVRRSGYAGMQVTVWGNSRETIRRPAEYLRDVLSSIGFRAKVRIIEPSIYFTMIGNQRTRAQVGVANWFQDYPHPLNWFDVLLNGRRIAREHNNNYSNANVEEINERIEELKQEPELTDEVNQEWAEVDRMVLENALWAPVVNRQFTDFFSPEMDLESCYVNHVVYQFIYTRSCKKS